MFDVTTIQSIAVATASSLVGFKQPTLSGAVTVAEKLVASRSGLTFEGGSQIVTVGNIQNTMQDPAATNDQVNDQLEAFAKEGFSKLCGSIFNMDDYLDGGLLFKHEADKSTRDLPAENSFVGFEIDICKANDLSVVLSRLLLNFNKDVSVKVVLFASQKKAPIYTATISALANDTVEEEINWIMSNYKYGGIFYLGYLTAGMTAKPIAKDYELASLQTIFNGIYIQPIQVVHNSITEMFDPNDVVYSDSSNSWGLNLDLSALEDWTQTIRSNQRMFGKALQLQVAVDVADMILHSTRSNSDEEINMQAIVFELNGNVNNQKLPEKIGIFKLLAAEEKRLRETFNPTGIQRFTLT